MLYSTSFSVLTNKKCKHSIDVFYDEVISFVKERTVRLLCFSDFRVKLVKGEKSLILHFWQF